MKNITFRRAALQKLIAFLILLLAAILIARSVKSQTVEIVTEHVSPADVYARICEEDQALKPFAEPTPIAAKLKPSDLAGIEKWSQPIIIVRP